MNDNKPSPSTEAFTGLILDPQEILPSFTQAANWQERYRALMLLGKRLPPLDDALRQESAQVRGCESNAWLYHKEIDGRHYYLADSDARIVKGLIALLLTAVQGQDKKTIAALDLHEYFDRLGLSGQLSPSRTNGVLALAEAIKAAAIQPS
ncbi:SufE family protein [Shewanella loihica]|uniref:Fe-S metabolism associated SufE n=1 Tax=Shewanella loihica (strain ATCC BAA-1088 / PV-4) TaxID=323850 RepID=A3QAV8_SHELP|nr:SufE family protein [Shewanella loihica]ABO22606.1 Fe-S metabolism associated SufE [Shewanella loihica PV-4]